MTGIQVLNRKRTKEDKRESMIRYLENPVNYYKHIERMKVCWSPESRQKAASTRKSKGHVNKIDWSDPEARKKYYRDKYVPKRKETTSSCETSLTTRLSVISAEKNRVRARERARRIAAEKRAVITELHDNNPSRTVSENKSEQIPAIEKPKEYVMSPWRAKWHIIPL